MSAAAKLRVAVVGVGHLGRIHARILAEHPGAALVCVVDADGERASAVADDWGAAALTDPRDLPADLDAVTVAVPTVHHAAVAIPLLERGIATLVEKPLASSVAEADRILAASRRSGAILAVGHVERFQPGLRRVREMKLAPRFIECHRLAPFSFRSTDVGVVHDLMIHDLDLVLDLVGSEVQSIDAAGGAILTEREDVASARIVFENGARANVTASRASLKPMRRFRLFSSQGYVSLDFTENRGLFVGKGPNWDEGRHALRHLDPAMIAARPDLVGEGILDVAQLELGGEQRPLQAEIDDFLGAVRAGTRPAVTGEDGRRALELAERIAADIRAQGW
jgi:predicted dehydrogenase